jgi:hypothetical protein
MINSGQYLGSYAPQCAMGYVSVSRSVYPSTYYERSSPFPNASPATGTYVNDGYLLYLKTFSPYVIYTYIYIYFL